MRSVLLAASVAAALLLGGCGSTAAPPPPPSSAPPPAAKPVQVPAAGSCHRMSYDQAVSSVATVASVPCGRTHASQTYAVGRLHTVVDGHLLALTSERVQAQVRGACGPALGHFLGGDARLTLLRPVWFLPTPAQAAAGAQWYRCDVVSVTAGVTAGVAAGSSRAGSTPSLASLTGSLKGVLGTPAGSAYAMCATAKPGTPDFRRVLCRAPHAWRALSVVAITAGPHGAYPGEDVAKAAGASICKQTAQDHASNALDYQWGYDWPSAEQWHAGQTYGVCWVPSGQTG